MLYFCKALQVHPLQMSRGYLQSIASVLYQLADEDDKLTSAEMCVLKLVWNWSWLIILLLAG